MQKRSLIWVLAAANVALASTLAWRGIKPNEAHAQAAPGRPEPGKYVMIPGSSQIGVSIIYFLDTANRRVGAIAPDAREAINVMPPLALDPIFDAAQSGTGGPRVNPSPQGRPNSDNRTRGTTPQR